MAGGRAEQNAALRGAQIITLLYSFLFFYLIASGYYLLFQKSLIVALCAAVLFASLAWWLARYIGSSATGIRGHIPLFILLLMISGMGVFNSLMLNLEGRRIFTETIDESIDRFDGLSARAAAELAKGGSSSPMAHMQRVDSLKAALFSEIRNPLNCGQGPEARRILASLQEELPDFRPLSNPRVDCSQNAKIIEDYEQRISELVDRAPWSNAALRGVMTDSVAAKRELDGLSRVANESFAPRLLQEVLPQLQTKNVLYRELHERLPSVTQGQDPLERRLDLRSVESLGEWSQLIYLLFSRFDTPTTYVYLFVAGFADWIMIYLFSLIRQNRGRRREASPLGTGIGRGFA